jgi:DNA-binding transcriptional ArsR family regulator
MAMKASASDSTGSTPQVAVETHALDAASCLFHCLADPSRLAIMSHLMLGEHKVVELTDHLGLAQSTVSAHLRCLLDGGLVRVRPQGRASFYSLVAEPEVLDVLAAAERLLVATASNHPKGV